MRRGNFDGGRCLLCEHFAGRARDPTTTLFRKKKGYCDHPDHPWGIWNVIQDIDGHNHCQMFQPTTEQKQAMRIKAAQKLWGRKP